MPDVEVELDLDLDFHWPKRGWLIGLAVVLAVALLWLLGRGHTPVVNGRPAVLTLQRKAVLDYLARADGWINAVASQNVTLDGLMPVSPTATVTPSVAVTGVVTATTPMTVPVLTSTIGLTVPVLPTATPMPVIAPALPGDLLSRVETLNRTRTVLLRLADELVVREPPPGMEGIHGLISDAVGASLVWCDALVDYYAAPAPGKVPGLLATQGQAEGMLDAARRALDERRAVIQGGGEW